MPIIDANVRLVAEDDARYPLDDNAPEPPTFRAPIQRFLLHANAAGVQGAVLVQPEAYRNDHRYLRHCLDQAPDRFRGACALDPSAADMAATLMDLTAHRSITALLIRAVREDRVPDFASPQMREVWLTAEQLGLVMQLDMSPRHAQAIVPLLESFPRVPVVLDHLGRPKQGSPNEISNVFRLSKLPNVYLKFSGLHLATNEPYPHKSLKPFIAGCVDLFGPHRLIWGGDYRGQPYGETIRAVDLLLDAVKLEDRAMIAGGTAARLYRFV
jgi:predicted TIM-barrel fold metal-dependent hydrolase